MIRSFIHILLMLIVSGTLSGFVTENPKESPSQEERQQVGTRLFPGERVTLENVQVNLSIQTVDGLGSVSSTEEMIYTGPVSISVLYGLFINPAEGGLPNTRLTEEQQQVITQIPTSSLFRIRFYVSIEWPERGQAEALVQTAHQEGKPVSIILKNIGFRLSGNDSNSKIVEITQYSLSSVNGGWITVELSDEANNILVEPFYKQEEMSVVGKPINSHWELILYENAQKMGSIQNDVCQFVECLPPEMIKQLSWQVVAENPIPAFCPGQLANGMMVKSSWFENRVVWSDFSRESGFHPQRPGEQVGQQLLFIEIASGPPKKTFSLVSRLPDDSSQIIEVDQQVLYGGLTDQVASDQYAGGLRFANQGLILSAYVPINLLLEHTYLVDFPFGPAWKLSCGQDIPEIVINTPVPQEVVENQAEPDEFHRAFPGFAPNAVDSQMVDFDLLNNQISGWTEMRWLGETEQVGEKLLSIEDYAIFSGQRVPVAYAPATGEIREIRTGLSYIGEDWNQVFIPPDSSLVMVKVNVQPESSRGCLDFRAYQWTISYPNFPATEAWYFSKNERLGNYFTADTNCLTNGWLYFYLPILTVDPEQVWIMVDVQIPDIQSMGIWKLSQKP